MQAMENSGDGFRALLEKNEVVTKPIGARMNEIFDPWAGLEHTDLAYERLGLGVTTKQ
jgi:hypothetical protein